MQTKSMDKNVWIAALIAAIIFGSGGYWAGTTFSSKHASLRGGMGNFTASGASEYAVRGSAAGGRTFGSGNTISGQVISNENGTLTVKLANSTSSDAASGTKIVLFSSSTQIDETQSVSASSLSKGTDVFVTGTPNSDGSITAQSIQIRPTGSEMRGAPMIPASR